MAEKMMIKARDSKLIRGPETLRLYLMILDLQNKHAELLGLLQEDAEFKFREDSPLIPFDLERDRIKVKSHVALEQWDATAALYKEMIVQNKEELSNYLGYFDIVAKQLVVAKEAGEGADIAAADPLPSYAACVEFMDGVIKEIGGGSLARTPLVARLELAARKEALTSSVEEPVTVCALLLQCTEVLGNKNCCFSDTKAYLALLGAETPTFLAGIKAQHEKSCAVGDAEEPAVKQIRRHIFCMEAGLFFFDGTAATVEGTAAIVTELLQRYADTLPVGTELKETELQHADPYGTIAAHYMVKLHKLTGDLGYIRRGIVVLERLLIASKHNAQARLLLVKFYFMTGAGRAAWPHWEACRVKQVQLDSIGNITSDHIPTLGCPEMAQMVCGKSRVFFNGLLL
jgi:hypothetical protein